MADKPITQQTLNTQLDLYPVFIALSIYFPCLFLPKSPRSLPFFDSFPLILSLRIPGGVLCNPEMLFPCIL